MCRSLATRQEGTDGRQRAIGNGLTPTTAVLVWLDLTLGRLSGQPPSEEDTQG